MRALSIFLKILSILTMLIGTAICTIVAVSAGVMEAYLAMGLALVGVLIVALNILGTGMALSHAHKTEKKVEELEKRLQDITLSVLRERKTEEQPKPVEPQVTQPQPVQIEVPIVEPEKVKKKKEKVKKERKPISAKVKGVIALTIIGAAAVMAFVVFGKSKEVKNAEAQIATLNEESTYKEINDVYSAYNAVKPKHREKVANREVLAEYCDLEGGALVLNDEMLEEIAGAFKETSELSHAKLVIMRYFSVKKEIEHWIDFEDIELASAKQKDPYTIIAKGTMMIEDEYGDWSAYRVEIDYWAEYDEESDKGYSLDFNVYFTPK